MTRCPICSEADAFTIYLDPLRLGQGRWLHCRACGFSGDTIELFGKLKHIGDLRTAVQKLVADGLFTGTSSLVTLESIKDYIDRYVKPRHRSRKIWNRMRCAEREISPPILELLQKEHLWAGWRSDNHARLMNFIGHGSKREIVGFFEEAILPKDGFKNCIVLNFQDVPGRTCRFMFISDHNQTWDVDMVRNPASGQEGGLAMLDGLAPFEDTVFAVSDWRFAFQMQRLNFVNSAQPLKLVVYNNDTRRAWNSVAARRIIFWSREVDCALFQQARQAGDGWIALRPDSKIEDCFEYVRKLPAETILARMEHYAKPWQNVLVGYLTDRDRTLVEAQAVVSKLELTVDERRRILEECEPKHRDRLDCILGEALTVHSVGHGANQILDRSDGWIARNKHGQEEPVSEARIRVHYEITEPESKKVYWKGVVLIRGQHLPFKDEAEVIRRNTADWLRELVAAAELGTVLLSRRHGDILFSLAQRFSSPRRITMSNHIGLRPDGRVVYPRFAIEGGELNSADTFLCPKDAPGWNLKFPETRAIRPDDPVTRSLACWTATASVFLYDLLQNYWKGTPVPTLLVGTEGSVARVVGTAFCAGADMRRYKIEPRVKGSKTPMPEAIRAVLPNYAYPSLVETKADQLLRAWPVRNSDNVFLTVSSVEAAAFRTGGHWLGVEAPELRRDVLDPLPPFDDVLFYLADLQKREFKLPELPPFEAVFTDWVTWYHRYACLDKDKLFEQARKCLMPQLPPAEALIELCGVLREEDRLKMEYTAFTDMLRNGQNPWKDDAGILVDQTDRRVFVSRPALRKALAQAKLPMSEFGPATEDLIQRQLMIFPSLPVEGWIIPLTFFDDTIRAWQLRRRDSGHS